ncbi:MAG: glycosyltransferase family 2 protein [Hyphomicrobiales bacterium]|nr:glycosyltransferase family 2 protein [Hyphomicrobiales bacterium]
MRRAVQPCVDVVIVNWNAGRQLGECVRSLALGAESVASITVVDNGSHDGSDQISAPELPLEIIRTGENLGFARACNLGAKRGAARYLLFFNPDAQLLDNSIGQAAAFLDAHPEYGVCGVQLKGEDGLIQRHCARFPDATMIVGGALGLDRIAPKIFPPMHMTDFDHRHSRAVDHTIGAFYMIRRALFEKIGGFDERFFVYLEDLDLSLRARDAGQPVYYLAEAVAFHKGGGTSEQVKARRLFYSLRSKLLFALKHFSGLGKAAVLAAMLGPEPAARLARAGVRANGAEASQTLQAYRMLIADLPQIMRRWRR